MLLMIMMLLATGVAFAQETESITMTAQSRPGLTIGAGGALLKDGKPYYGVGINYFSAFVRRLENPEDTTYRQGFADLAKHGIPFVRFAACGFWPKNWKLYLEDKEAYFRLLDDVIKAAEEHDIGLIPSLFWYYACVPDIVGEPMNQWGNSESKTIGFMRRYTEEVVKRYVNSPAIWAWELGNEYSLAADLPNAADHRPWIHPDLGTPTSRSEADDLTHDMLLVALREFGKTVRAHDPYRAITSGNSLPRAAAHHMRMERSWTQDTREEFKGNLVEVTPDPLNLVSVHIYPMDVSGRFNQPYTSYEELLSLCLDAARKAGKGLFVGEFGALDDEAHGGRDKARRDNYAMIAALERCQVQLSALWNFDLPAQEDSINVTTTNHRSYLLNALGHANRRIQVCRAGKHKVELRSGNLSGTLYDNEGNQGRPGNGFNPLCYGAYPERNLYRGDCVGLNFEHIFNGVVADRARCMFTPRKDACTLIVHSDSSASIRWPAESSAWGTACEMKYTLAGENCVDMEFVATLTKECFGKGYLAMMWASYMNQARDRKIHFYGMNGESEGWVAFGEDTADGFETGAVACHGVPNLPYEEGAQTLNIVEHPTKKFLLPFYYGLVDGDGDFSTQDDMLAYIMMFDQREPIRFALWNFNKDMAGRPDAHGPAWDWQFVIRNPEVGKTYNYKARLVIKPFVSPEDVREEYQRWVGKPSKAAS